MQLYKSRENQGSWYLFPIVRCKWMKFILLVFNALLLFAYYNILFFIYVKISLVIFSVFLELEIVLLYLINMPKVLMIHERKYEYYSTYCLTTFLVIS